MTCDGPDQALALTGRKFGSGRSATNVKIAIVEPSEVDNTLPVGTFVPLGGRGTAPISTPPFEVRVIVRCLA